MAAGIMPCGEDEALVVLEIDAVGFSPVIVEVPLSWDQPDCMPIQIKGCKRLADRSPEKYSSASETKAQTDIRDRNPS